LAQLPLNINLHGYREAIARFYEDGELQKGVVATAPAEEQAPEMPILPQQGMVAIAPQAAKAPPHPKKPLAVALGSGRTEPLPVDGKHLPGRGGHGAGEVALSNVAKDSDELVGSAFRKTDTIVVRTNDIALDVICDYEVRRIDIRNIETRDAVVVKMKNATPVVLSADVDVSRDVHGVYCLGDWPVTVRVSEAQGDCILANVQVLGSGPQVLLRI
jgi:hypothetical protein